MQKIIPLKEWRSIKEWCRKNSVAILFDKGSKQGYVIKEEFEEAIDRVPEKYLLKKFNQVNTSLLSSSIAFCAKCQGAIDVNRSHQSYNYEISGENEKRFKSILLNIINELPSVCDGKPVAHTEK